MAAWLSRTIKRLATAQAAAKVQPLPPAELHKAVDSAKKLIAEGNFVDALATLAPAVTSNPDDADALAYYGVATFRAGNPAEARTALTLALQINRDHLVASKFLVEACNALADYPALEAAALNALRLAPRDREVLVHYGIACSNRLKVDEAAESFSKAVEMAPTDLVPLLNIESLSIRSLRHRRTLERSPKIAAARSQAINRLRAQHRKARLDDEGLKNLLMLLGGAQETFGGAVELARELALRREFSPSLADQLAIIFYHAGDLPNLLRFRGIAVDAAPDQPLPSGNLAHARLSAGVAHWQENWEAIRTVESFYNLDVAAREVPVWTGQRLGRKKILVYQEQGIGDAILALRLVPILAKRGIRFDLWVLPALAGLAASVKGYENLVRTDSRPDARTVGCDYGSGLFGLISAAGVRYEELKQNPTVLLPGAERLPEVRARLRALKGKRVGLAYGGNPDRRDDWLRGIAPETLKPLAAIDGISWVNLAIDPRPDKGEVARMLRMDDPMPQVRDFEDTAAIISELDAVVAIDSSTAHLAGSLAKPLWVLVPPMLDWRWQIGNDLSPWWPTGTVLRSPRPGVWDGIIPELAKQIEAWRD